MNAQIPFPSFEDIRKLLEFWTDQQDKWFYFELGITQTGSTAGQIGYAGTDLEFRMFQYSQSRIVGKIHDVVSYPLSLLLQDATIFTVNLTFPWQKPNLQFNIPDVEITNEFNSLFPQTHKTDMVNVEKRNKYGLVFSQIAYYEPIDDIEQFIKSDLRVRN